MLGVNENFSQKIQSVKKQVKDKYVNVVKPAIVDGFNSAKNLSKDTVEFVKKNPKKVAKFAGAAAIVGLITAGIAHMVELTKKNKLLNKLAERRKVLINYMKEDIADKQFLIDTLHETVQAAKK